MNSIFLHYFGLSLSMSIVIAVLLALNRLFGSKFKAKCRYLVWIIITGRLLVPAFFLIPTALFNINFNLTATNRPFSSSSPQNDAYTAPAHIEPEKNNRNSLNFESDIHSSEFVETQSNLNEDLSPATSPSNQVNRDDYYPVYYPSGFEPTETYANDEDIISDSRSDLSNDKESSDIIRILSTAWLAGAVVYVSVILAAHV